MPKSTAKKPRERVAREEAIAEGGRRKLILDAAIESVLVDGYARTNMSHVARRAGVPRPLVQYYFSNLPMLLRAAIEAIAERWRTSYFSSVRVAAPNGAMGVDEGIDYLWSHMHSPEYLAYQELLLVARTDPEVAELVVELHQEGVRRRRGDAAIAYSEYAAADAQAFADTGEFTAIFLEGLLLRQLRMSDQMLETDRQLSMLKHFLGTYWASHGLPQAALATSASLPTSSPDPIPGQDFAELARELIRRLQPFVRPA